jgi:hypothetical protein
MGNRPGVRIKEAFIVVVKSMAEIKFIGPGRFLSLWMAHRWWREGRLARVSGCSPSRVGNCATLLAFIRGSHLPTILAA